MDEGNARRFSVLVVETDSEFFESVKIGLRHARFPHAVDQALDYEEALAKLRSTSYDLVLAETCLDDHQGMDLFRMMSKEKMNLPFILLTDIRDDKLVREARKQGVADVIIKSESQYHDLAEKLKASYKAFCENKKPGKRKADVKLDETPEGPQDAPDLIGHRDELTGLYTHSYLQDRVVQEFSAAARYGYPLACLIIDIDNFKGINEDKGYRVGDLLLKETADLIFDNCRMSDVIARYGGEEFAVLLPHVSYKGAEELTDRLRKIFAEHVFLKTTEQIRLAISIGISAFPEDPMTKRCELLTFAAQALNRSKAAGRNCRTSFKEVVPIMAQGLPELKISEEKIALFQAKMAEISDAARHASVESSKALIIALESKDRYTAGHAASTAKYSFQVAQTMGLDPDEAESVQLGALLHDIGKICIPDQILLKPGKLTFTEYEAMKQHPYLGYKMLKPIKFLKDEALFVLHHHEWFNGEGYPCRLKGNEIPLGARIIAVIDSYDTIRMAGGRYRKTSTVEDAVNELIHCSGTQFDPHVVKAFIAVLQQRGELRTENYHKDKLQEALKAA